jgi:UDP-N-acetylglucosamine--N-acetylmuramyl-(pentapeptide) pyrophosphoryl-undecaprenol N-acetylglucosamine transferase
MTEATGQQSGQQTGPRVLIAAGGTGGHVMPGLALARALTARAPGTVVTWAGTSRGIESRAVAAAGIELDLLPILPLSRRLSLDSAMAPFAAVAGTFAARSLIRRRGADVVVGMGGYVTLPVAIGAKLAGVPVVLHEQNAIPGLANRLAARVATVVALGVPEAAGAFGGARTVPVGNPVRPELAHLDRDALHEAALAEFGLRHDRYTVFVFGGSQGARRLNQAIIDTAGRWPHPGLVQILHACGGRDEDLVKAGWTEVADRLGDLHVSVVPFIDRMDLAYAIADLAVTRAGALTVAELTAAGLPAIVVPLPHAVGGHQAANAQVLAHAGGVVAVDDAELDGARLVREADELLGQPRELARMAKTMRDLSRPDAARELADLVLFAAGRGLS